MIRIRLTTLSLLLTIVCYSQTNQRIYNIVDAVSSKRIKNDVTKLENLGTRHTLSDTTSSTWDNSRYVGDISKYTLDGIVIDNYFFGISSVGKDGFESPVVFPNGIFR